MTTAEQFNRLATKIGKFGPRGIQLLKDEIEGATRDIEAEAKQRAPVDNGTLRQSINSNITNNGLTGAIQANASYAAYQEFGTGTLVSVTAETREIAEYYKGAGVKQINLRPQPFLFPAYFEGRKKLLQQLKRGLDRMVR